MSENPYQSPEHSGNIQPVDSVLRRRARRSFRITVLLLLVPAGYNYYAFDRQAIASGGLPGGVAMLYRTINILAFVVGAALIWLYGLALLEAIARQVRNGFASAVDQAAWQKVLYRSLNWSPYLAAPGAVLWIVWVLGFYQIGVNFYVISWLVGVPAHLLGACLYVPLVYRWYRLATSRSG